MVTSRAVVGSSAMNEVGVVEQCDGDSDALAHAAGELVRVGAQPFIGGGDADAAQGVPGAGAGHRPADGLMRLHGLDHLGVDAQDRVERHHRVLEDHGDAAAAETAHRGFRQAHEVLAAEQDAAASDAAGRVHQPYERVAGHGLARAGFADEAEDAAPIDAERDAVHRAEGAGAGGEVGA